MALLYIVNCQVCYQYHATMHRILSHHYINHPTILSQPVVTACHILCISAGSGLCLSCSHNDHQLEDITWFISSHVTAPLGVLNITESVWKFDHIICNITYTQSGWLMVFWVGLSCICSVVIGWNTSWVITSFYHNFILFISYCITNSYMSFI